MTSTREEIISGLQKTRDNLHDITRSLMGQYEADIGRKLVDEDLIIKDLTELNKKTGSMIFYISILISAAAIVDDLMDSTMTPTGSNGELLN